MGTFGGILIVGVLVLTFCHVNGSIDAAGKANVLSFGAVGDGKKDDTQAFSAAWKAICDAKTGIPTMIVPKGKTFLVNPVTFQGPCKAANVNIHILGTIVSSGTTATWKGIDAGKWITFKGISGLKISGSGTIDGRGKAWWDQSCRYHPGPGCTKLAPTSMNFLTCNNSHVTGINIVNSPQTHILLMGVYGFDINHIHINSPGDSPNTDGIHLQFAHHVTISNTDIKSGDDCVSIGDKTSDIKVVTVNCGPGHGVSIGSLGGSGNAVEVEDIHVFDVNFIGTTNGVRIKTYQVGTGYARGFSFKKLNFTNVANPIMIDQYYCSVAGACKAEKTGVHISNVTYEGLTGTSISPVAINLNCSQVVACTDLTFKSIRLSPAKPTGIQTHNKLPMTVTSNCINAHGTTSGIIQPPIPCLNKN